MSKHEFYSDALHADIAQYINRELEYDIEYIPGADMHQLAIIEPDTGIIGQYNYFSKEDAAHDVELLSNYTLSLNEA